MASKSLLADILTQEHKLREAEELARQAFDEQLRVLGPQHRDTLESLWLLGTALVEMGRYEDAKELYLDTLQKIRAEKKDETRKAATRLLYNLACHAAIAERRDEALEYLDQAVQAGYTDAKHMRTDDDLKSLRNEARFDKLVAKAKAISPQPAVASK